MRRCVGFQSTISRVTEAGATLADPLLDRLDSGVSKASSLVAQGSTLVQHGRERAAQASQSVQTSISHAYAEATVVSAAWYGHIITLFPGSGH